MFPRFFPMESSRQAAAGSAFEAGRFN